MFLHKNVILVHYKKSLIICTKGICGWVLINTLNQPSLHTHSSWSTCWSTLDQHLINTWLTLDWHSVEYAWSKEPSFCGHQDIFTKKYQVFMIPVSLLWKFSNIIFQRSCSLLAGISYFLCYVVLGVLSWKGKNKPDNLIQHNSIYSRYLMLSCFKVMCAVNVFHQNDQWTN